MKTLIALFLTAVSVTAFADGQPAQKPDIAHVISITDTQEACGIVPVQMVYEDSQGVRHTLAYQVWGDGCSGN
ncbi:DUF2790 domain-containing protein [Pseudomonas gingeri]|uniref:DUF2790 domain-containing protein n=1 Tax=Pseudomonas gingeri TaxID=117681 RepID=A0A7Y7YGE5_9PSED|nr:DUF2790 domain-containing protein [Pseudomonas gingeri]NWB25860.1 DUF2790 domain-containing protein [Pseudomonas gingeri]NWC34635.1 DUF2790 domain-containing protein [Pseudomonas gingeri]NWD08426.1 DUF2790 domain-containing protein [Pseudomonas gingeri]NWD47742.1 DUF2790 domain-containing protein [Pseudomonas gingeri]NWE26182.1 DUF2790 domain-containing protein [Pseudomonas gingeri]